MTEPANPRRGSRPRRVERPRHRLPSRRPRIEPLEIRAVPASIAASFDFGGGITSRNVPLASYSWSAAAAPGSAATASAFELTLSENSADAVALAALARGKTVPEVDVTDVVDAKGDRLTYKLKDVLVSSVRTAGTSGAVRPTTTVDLVWAKMEEDFQLAGKGGGLGAPRVTVWDASKDLVEGSGLTALPAPAADGIPLALTTYNTSGALALASLTQSDTATAANGDSGGFGATPGPFVLTAVAPSIGPDLLAELVRGTDLAEVDLTARRASDGATYDADKLSGVTLSSLGTSDTAGGQPVTTIGLSWTKLEEDYSPTNPDGSLGTPAPIVWNANTAVVSGGLTTLPAPPDRPTALALTADGATGKLPVESASFAASLTPSAGLNRADRATPGPLIVTAAGSVADAGLLAELAKNAVIAKVDLLVTPAPGSTPTSVSFVLHDATVTSFSTTLAAGGASTSTFTLAWRKLEEDVVTTDADGFTTTVTTIWDASAARVVDAGPLRLPTPAAPPPLGLTVPGLPGEATALLVTAGGTSNPGVGTRIAPASPGPFVVTLVGSVADPGLLAKFAGPYILPEVDLHHRDGSGQEYLTEKLTGVTITSLQTTIAADGTIATTIGLSWMKLEEDYRTANPDGSLGDPAPARVIWNVSRATVDAGPLQLPTPAAPPPLGLTVAGLPGELPLTDLSFGATTTQTIFGDDADTTSPGPFVLTIPGSAADPGLLADLAEGVILAEVDLHVLNAGGSESRTYKLFDAKITSIRTTITPDGPPVSTVELTWEKLEEDDRPINPDGSLGTPARVIWDVSRATVDGGLAQLPTPAAPPPLGLTIAGLPGELTAASYSFGATAKPPAPDGSPSPGSPGPILVTLAGLSDPGLIADLVNGVHFTEVDLHVRTPGAIPREFLTYRLKDAQITSITTTLSAGAQPVTTIGISWWKLEVDDRPQGPGDPLGPAAVATWDARQALAGVTVDAIGSVHLMASGFGRNRRSGHFTQTLTITNIGPEPLDGSPVLVLDGLAGATLVGATGTDPVIGAPGSPTLVLPTIGVGQTITLPLEFIDPTGLAITYTPRLLIGG